MKEVYFVICGNRTHLSIYKHIFRQFKEKGLFIHFLKTAAFDLDKGRAGGRAFLICKSSEAIGRWRRRSHWKPCGSKGKNNDGYRRNDRITVHDVPVAVFNMTIISRADAHDKGGGRYRDPDIPVDCPHQGIIRRLSENDIAAQAGVACEQ